MFGKEWYSNMKFKKASKIIVRVVLVSMLSLTLSVPVYAAGTVSARATIVNGTVNSDGVRLRKEGWTGGTILELMYKGESVKYYPQVYGTDPEYNYIQRSKTNTYGFVDHHYINY